MFNPSQNGVDLAPTIALDSPPPQYVLQSSSPRERSFRGTSPHPDAIGLEELPNQGGSPTSFPSGIQQSNGSSRVPLFPPRPAFVTRQTSAVAEEDTQDSEDENSLAEGEIQEASSRRNYDFHDVFPNIPKKDKLLEDYGCEYQREILVIGRLYISDRHFGFHANILGWTVNFFIPFSSVITMEKRNNPANSIALTTSEHVHVFATFRDHDEAFNLISRVWKLARTVPMELCQRENEDNGKHMPTAQKESPSTAEPTHSTGTDDALQHTREPPLPILELTSAAHVHPADGNPKIEAVSAQSPPSGLSPRRLLIALAFAIVAINIAGWARLGRSAAQLTPTHDSPAGIRPLDATIADVEQHRASAWEGKSKKAEGAKSTEREQEKDRDLMAEITRLLEEMEVAKRKRRGSSLGDGDSGDRHWEGGLLDPGY